LGEPQPLFREENRIFEEEKQYYFAAIKRYGKENAGQKV